MSDGREEREESKKRIEQERQKESHQDRLDDDGFDEWEPERVDS